MFEEELSLSTGKLGMQRAAILVAFKDGVQYFSDDEMTNPVNTIQRYVELSKAEYYGRVNEKNYKILLNPLKERRSPVLYLEETIHWIHMNYCNGVKDKRALALDDMRLFKKEKYHKEPGRVINLIDTILEFTARVGTLDILDSLPELQNDYDKTLVDSDRDINQYKNLDIFDHGFTSHKLGYSLGRIYHLSDWEGKVDFRDLMKMNIFQMLSHIREFEDYKREQFIPDLILN
jgi:hypothetical protein